VLVEKVLSVPQLGIEGTIPIERRLFSDRTVQLEFAPSGELTKAKFIDASGEAAKASAGKESAAPVVSAPQGKKGDTTSKPTTPASPQ